MKKYLFLLASCLMFSLSLSAQSPGIWGGEVSKDGKRSKFMLKLNSNGTFSAAYDLNPNDLSYDLNPNDVAVKGRWTVKGDVLIFQVRRRKVQLKKTTSKGTQNKGSFLLTFKKGSELIIYSPWGQPPSSKFKPMSSMFGWDEGVAAIVVNHEERD